jgi:hypothetical protein
LSYAHSSCSTLYCNCNVCDRNSSMRFNHPRKSRGAVSALWDRAWTLRRNTEIVIAKRGSPVKRWACNFAGSKSRLRRPKRYLATVQVGCKRM